MSYVLNNDISELDLDTPTRAFVEGLGEELAIGGHLDDLIPTIAAGDSEESRHDWARRMARIYACRRLVAKIVSAYDQNNWVCSQLDYIESMSDMRKQYERQHDA